MPLISYNSRLGFAYETTWGTAAAAPTSWIGFKTLKASDNVKYIVDNQKRGNLAKDFAAYNGVQSGDISITKLVNPDTIGYFLKGLLGGYTVTGSGAPYTHTFTLSTTQPPSFTLFDYDGYNERYWSGAMIESMDFKFTIDGELDADVKMKSKVAQVSGSPHSATAYSQTPVFLGYQAGLQIAGQPNLHMVGGNLSFKRALKMTFGANSSINPTKITMGEMEVTGKLDFEVEDYTELNYYLQNTQPSVTLTFTNGTNVLTFQMSKVAFDKSEGLDRGSEVVRVSTSIRALYNATDGGPCKITLQNGITTF